MNIINTESRLLEELKKDDAYDAIVVEGYDGVGKGRVLNLLSELFGVTPYRPDYNLWQKYDLRHQDRWKISGFFWDVYSHFNKNSLPLSKPMLFDRGVLSGAVYNDDRIIHDYKSLLRSKRVLHILVTCDKDSFIKFAMVRGIPTIDDESYEEYLEYTRRYREALVISGVEYIVYENRFDTNLADDLSKTCEGCGHYSYGVCRHPNINAKVNRGSERCSLSLDKEVQDNVTEMQCV